MSAKTIHGWPVIADGSSRLLQDFRIPGTGRSIKLRKDVGPYLVSFAAQYHKKIAPIDEGTFDDWGWSPVRQGNASSKISDHCAGVAMDLNATREGSQSKYNTWWKRNPVKYLQLKRMLKRWRLLEAGIDYKNFWDPMHFVIDTPSVTAVKAEMKRMGIDAKGRIKGESY